VEARLVAGDRRRPARSSNSSDITPPRARRTSPSLAHVALSLLRRNSGGSRFAVASLCRCSFPRLIRYAAARPPLRFLTRAISSQLMRSAGGTDRT
jgi:hypothetical protein